MNLGVEPNLVDTPSDSGLGQKIARCPHCRVAVWSHYAGSGPAVRFVRVGTLDDPDLLPPDVHIFTASKQPWVVLPAGAPAFAEYYERESLWPPDSLARRQALLPLIQAWQAQHAQPEPHGGPTAVTLDPELTYVHLSAVGDGARCARRVGVLVAARARHGHFRRRLADQ